MRNHAVDKYVNQWIINIEDIKERVREIHKLVKKNNLNMAYSLLPNEKNIF
ncbi:DUF4291 family protein [Providencia stuartii]|uniref:DUF4291 family protein n=1 Tax=Providencia TaxID=586 RepID=UPI0003180A18|nr:MULTISPECIES: DUF4291 family protein [Providencia]MDE8745285.1 DUF4291 family protein [Providencia thailandensis]MDE8764483.1 DUF4291 family protein [Providencia thailandensis]MDE8776987.1 DUF4291 family protein [Providencia thailandensis]MDE8780976.1 DUF4291 family protein [Providencia thailandensis]MDE8784970.1 DUF4291 family protein [Providencia thailandensis]